MRAGERSVDRGRGSTPTIRPGPAAARPRVVYVTSFDASLYAASGRHLVRSFFRHRVPGTLLCCVEGGVASRMRRRPGLEIHDLDGDAFLAGWLRRHAGVIPRVLGGAAGPCACPEPANPWAPSHRPGCPGAWFNRNASRWFRKIAALARALTLPGDVVVWLDADCRFLRRLAAPTVVGWFGRASVVYLQSPDRAFPETGVMGFRLARGGRRFLEALIARYTSGAFRRNRRWDDCAQFQLTRRALPSPGCRDLATHASGDAHVVRHSPVGRFIAHDKGRHARRRLMT